MRRTLCGSRKYPYPPQGGSLEIRGEGGCLTPKILKESMKLKWNFQRGVGFNQKPLHGGSTVLIFSGTTHYAKMCET